MAGVSLGTGLTSGIDYSTMISQLMQIEAQPQTLLKSQLADTKEDAGAFRDINSAFAALATAAEALTKPATWTPAKATSSSSTVSASAASGALSGSISFTVDKLATSHSIVTGANWTATTDAFGLGSPLTLTTSAGSFDITPTDTDGNGTVSLGEAVSAINAAGKGVTATPVNTGSGYRLQLTSAATGAASSFSLTSPTMPSGTFSTLRAGQNAEITIGGAGGYKVTSPTNTFSGVMDGTTFTVSQAGTTEVTIGVATDSGAITSAVQSLVTAANAALDKIGSYTYSGSEIAPLKGNYNLVSLGGQVLEAVSTAVSSTSAGVAGLQLTKDGRLTFDSNKFAEKLKSDPAAVQKIFSGTTLVGADNVSSTPDDVVGVDGIGARLAVLANRASDEATGTLISLAKGQDTRAEDLQDQIDAWDLRLELREKTLTAQFSAMESMLGTLQNQMSWLSSQINSLPKWSSSSSDS
jgi:flagellar hook-associated protein 2